jgi:hypothetical protein
MEPTTAMSKEFVGLAIGVGVLIAERVVVLAKSLATKLKDSDSRTTTTTTVTHSAEMPCEDLKYLRANFDRHVTERLAVDKDRTQALSALQVDMAAVKTDVGWLRKRVENGGGKIT